MTWNPSWKHTRNGEFKDGGTKTLLDTTDSLFDMKTLLDSSNSLAFPSTRHPSSLLVSNQHIQQYHGGWYRQSNVETKKDGVGLEQSKEEWISKILMQEKQTPSHAHFMRS